MIDDATPAPGPPEPTHPIPRSRRRRRTIGAVSAAVVVLLAATGGAWWWWRDDHTFCHEVAALPDVTESIDRTGSPAEGLLAYADQLDQVADEAPDAATADAARTLAAAERSVAQAMTANPLTAGASSAVSGAATSEVAAAQQQLQQTISTSCRG